MTLLLKPITFKVDYSKKFALFYFDTFGIRIRKLRTATELGNKININPTFLTFIERDQFNLTYENIHKLYSYLGCKIISSLIKRCFVNISFFDRLVKSGKNTHSYFHI